jgi:hypothetical protein
MLGPGGVVGIEEAFTMCASLMCRLCEEPGASVGCTEHNCAAVSHVLCARDEGWGVNEELFDAKCPEPET